MGKLLAAAAAVMALPLVLLVGGGLAVAMVFGGGGQVGPPANLGVVHPPATILALDIAVSQANPPLVPCHVSASILLAQQQVESGYNPAALSSAGAIGLAQFEPATFAEYDMPPPPGGATPPSMLDPVDEAYAEARMLCSDGIETSPTAALVTYNCGSTSPACMAASSGYAAEILGLAARIATPATTPARP
ncbi:MAG: transglycosylase SLT domain-containing protein [Acidimicrobiales bacterium]